MNEFARWIVLVVACLGPWAAVLGLWTVLGWRGTVATGALLVVGGALTWLVQRLLYHKPKPRENGRNPSFGGG